MMPALPSLMSPAATTGVGPSETSAVTEGDAFMQLLAQLAGMEPDAQPEIPLIGPKPEPAGIRGASSLIGSDGAEEGTADDPEQDAKGESDAQPHLTALMAILMPAAAQPASEAPADPAAVMTSAAAAVQPQVNAAPDAAPTADLPDLSGPEIAAAPATLREAAQPALQAKPQIAVLIGPRRLTAPASDRVAEAALVIEAPAVVIADAIDPGIVPTVAPARAPTDVAPVSEPSPAPGLAEAQLDLARDGEWLDRLAKDIARTAGEDGRLRFRLNPETLGTLHVELSQGSAGTSIRLIADTTAAQAIIAEAQSKLVAEARAQGVRVAEAHVDLSSGGGSTSTDSRGRHGAPQEEIVRTFSVVEPDETPASRVVRTASERYA